MEMSTFSIYFILLWPWTKSVMLAMMMAMSFMTHLPLPLLFFKRFWMKMCNMYKHIEVKGHLGGLWDPFVMFCPKVFIFIVNSPPSKLPTPTFIQIFAKLLGTCSLKCPESPLVCQQASFPIFSGGVGFILVQAIALGGLFRELGFYCLSHCLFILVKLSPFHIGSCRSM